MKIRDVNLTMDRTTASVLETAFVGCSIIAVVFVLTGSVLGGCAIHGYFQVRQAEVLKEGVELPLTSPANKTNLFIRKRMNELRPQAEKRAEG